MGEVIYKAQASYVSKPILTVLARVSEDLHCYVVENITREVADHGKECELLLMEEGLARKAPC